MKLYINYKTRDHVVVGEKMDYAISHNELTQRGYDLALFISGSWDSILASELKVKENNIVQTRTTKLSSLHNTKLQKEWKEKTPLTTKYQMMNLQKQILKLEKEVTNGMA